MNFLSESLVSEPVVGSVEPAAAAMAYWFCTVLCCQFLDLGSQRSDLQFILLLHLLDSVFKSIQALFSHVSGLTGLSQKK